MSKPPSREMIEVFRRNPMKFREYLTVDGVSNARPCFKDVMAPFQRKDFEARDPCLLWLTGVEKKVGGKSEPYPEPPIKQFYVQRGRGSSKTTDIAIDSLWVMAFSKILIDGVVAAEDKDQARLMFKQAEKVISMNPWIGGYVNIQVNKMFNEATGSIINTMARDSGSSWGITPDYVICDEWTHWTKEEMWESISSSAAKKSKFLYVGCNAGSGNDWKYRTMMEFKSSPDWYFSAPDGAAPWYPEKVIAQQQRQMSPRSFARLWMNRWQTDGDQFLEPHTVAACEDETLDRHDEPQDGLQTYFITFDYGESKDRAVGAVSHWDGQQDIVYVDRMDVFAPECQPTGSVLIKDVMRWLKSMYDTFSANDRNVYFILDKYQLLSCIQELREYVEDPETIVEFEFASGNGNFEMAKLLRQKVINQQIKWYKDCGEIYDQDGQIYRPQGTAVKDTLASELAELIVVKRGINKWRFDHPSWGHDDRAFTVGAVLWFIAKMLREADEEDVESESIYQ